MKCTQSEVVPSLDLGLSHGGVIDLYPDRGTRPGHGSDILWTDNIPIGLFTAIECD